MLARILLVTRSAHLRSLMAALEEPGRLVEVWDGTSPIVDLLRRQPVDLVVIEASTVRSPRAFLGAVQMLPSPPAVLVLSEPDAGEDRPRLLVSGAAAVLAPSVETAALADVASRLLQRRSEELGRELAARHVASQPRLSDFISNSPVMAAFIRLVQRVARSDASLLILGETGVGKERLARAIHAEGSRARNPFVAVNCGALPEALLESELFGHREGAFTGAKRDRRGLFELAHRGTIFLDEIGDMPLHLQVKLLRVLQERTFRRLGGDRDLTVDIRVVAATNVDLKAQVETRQFRQDLYYRLGVVTLTIPPLRERRADIPKLIGDYIAHFGAKLGSDVASMSEQALERCLTYSWPGNVRELINVVERAMLLADGDVVRADDLPASIGGYTSLPPLALAGERPSPASELSGEPGATPADLRELEGWFSLPLREARQRWERLYLASLLRETSGRIGETAARAGLSTRVLHDYMKRYGLRKEAFRKPQGPREP